MRIVLPVGASDRWPLQFGVCRRLAADYIANDVGWLYEQQKTMDLARMRAGTHLESRGVFAECGDRP